jgi:hypothetical protein
MAATGVEAWDERWATPEGRDDWLVPHPAVFVEHGFAVEAIDGAAAGLDFACREAAARTSD